MSSASLVGTMSNTHNGLPLPVVIDSSTSPSTDNDKPIQRHGESGLSNWGFGLRLAFKVLCVVLILLVILAIVVTLVLVR